MILCFACTYLLNCLLGLLIVYLICDVGCLDVYCYVSDCYLFVLDRFDCCNSVAGMRFTFVYLCYGLYCLIVV